GQATVEQGMSEQSSFRGIRRRFWEPLVPVAILDDLTGTLYLNVLQHGVLHSLPLQAGGFGLRTSSGSHRPLLPTRYFRSPVASAVITRGRLSLFACEDRGCAPRSYARCGDAHSTAVHSAAALTRFRLRLFLWSEGDLLDCGRGRLGVWNGRGNVPSRTSRSICWRLKRMPLTVARSPRVSTRTGPVWIRSASAHAASQSTPVAQARRKAPKI